MAEHFVLCGRVLDVVPYGAGLINNTYLVTTSSVQAPRVILQRINQQVFPKPQWVVSNMVTLIRHVDQEQHTLGFGTPGLRFPKILETHDGNSCAVDAQGELWRALSFIERTRTLKALQSLSEAEEIGFALGRFHRLVERLDSKRLHETLPGFHIAPAYFRGYLRASAVTDRRLTPTLRACCRFVETHQHLIGVLETAKHDGLLPLRPIHGDPKLDNFLFDEHSPQVISLIDLDTIMPGLIHYDVGDCLRSCCNAGGESGHSAAAVDFNVDLARTILQRYFAETKHFLPSHECNLLYDAIRLIPFELGLRFLTDYLMGNQYFKVNHEEQNLQRAETQFQLVQRIEQRERDIRSIVKDLSRA